MSADIQQLDAPVRGHPLPLWLTMEAPTYAPKQERPRVNGQVIWLYKVKGSGAMTNVTMAIAELAQEAYLYEVDSFPVVTGTTHDVAYLHDSNHLEGCAVDLRTRGLSLEQAVAISQHLAALVHDRVDPGVRVVLWHKHRRRPNHIHVAIQDCGRSEARLVMWSLNGRRDGVNREGIE